MKEIVTMKTNAEFEKFLKEFDKTLDKSLISLTSKRCDVSEALLRLDDNEVFSVGQLRRIFELAK